MFWLEIRVGKDRIPVGKRYATLEEAQEAAKWHIGNAPLQHRVLILKQVGYAGLAGDGEPYLTVSES